MGQPRLSPRPNSDAENDAETVEVRFKDVRREITRREYNILSRRGFVIAYAGRGREGEDRALSMRRGLTKGIDLRIVFTLPTLQRVDCLSASSLHCVPKCWRGSSPRNSGRIVKPFAVDLSCFKSLVVPVAAIFTDAYKRFSLTRALAPQGLPQRVHVCVGAFVCVCVNLEVLLTKRANPSTNATTAKHVEHPKRRSRK